MYIDLGTAISKVIWLIIVDELPHMHVGSRIQVIYSVDSFFCFQIE